MTEGMWANPEGMADKAGKLNEPGQMIGDLIAAHNSRMAEVASWWGKDDPPAVAMQQQYSDAENTFSRMVAALLHAYASTGVAMGQLAKLYHEAEQQNVDVARRLTQGHG